MILRWQDTLTIDDLPKQCIEDCSGSGDVTERVESWLNNLDFTCDEVAGFSYLVREVGLDPEDFLLVGDGEGDYDSEQINLYILWLACHSIAEDGIFVLGI